MKKLILTLALSLSLVSTMMLGGCGDGGSEETSADPLKAKCSNGVMIGQEENGVISFKGVPYAEQPVGDLRWKAPVAAKDSDEEIECFDYGNTAIQYEWPTEEASYAKKGEDCLSLNVWKSAEDTGSKPVMVWIHGGGYSWGGTTDPIYDGQKFAEANPDVMLVTVNYRLGLLSWASFAKVKGGEDYSDANLGIRDNICALEWIQKNIEQFGGDPENVTIFGESAGGGSVNILVGSEKADGLFNRAIVESGSDLNLVSTMEAAEDYGKLIAKTAGCKNMDELMEVSGEELMALDTENWLGDESPGPVVDGDIIKEDHLDAFKDAGARGIDLMIGSNKDEQNYFVQELEGDNKFEDWSAHLNAQWDENYDVLPPDGRELMDEYMKIQQDQGLERIFGISRYITEGERYGVLKRADLFTEGGGNAYVYLWEVPSTSDKYFKSACHAVELSYVFNTLHDTIYTGKNPDEETARKTQEAWTNFAKTGDPSIDGVEWSKYTTENRETMLITLDGWKLEKDPYSDARELYRKLQEDYQVTKLVRGDVVLEDE